MTGRSFFSLCLLVQTQRFQKKEELMGMPRPEAGRLLDLDLGLRSVSLTLALRSALGLGVYFVRPSASGLYKP